MDIIQLTIKGDTAAIQAAQKAITLALGVVKGEHKLSYEWVDCGYVDDVGGHHDSGCGWMPDGTWCGECTQSSCRDCGVWQYKLKRQEIGETNVG